MNISITGDTATINQVWDQHQHCGTCCPQVETGLKVTRTATHITLLGDEGKTQYYSFEAAISTAGDAMENGAITHGGRTYGTFTAQKNGCPTITQNCSASISFREVSF